MARRTPPPAVPALPPPTATEEAAARSLTARMRRLADEVRARNLAGAVLLAQQAACGHGPLVEHFNQLGRDWGHLLRPTNAKRTAFQVIEGGAD